MGNALLIAAGGGGDAISAAALGPILGLTDEHPTVMTYAWDRLLIDPLPGPRSADDFASLTELAPNVLQITPDTRPIPPAGSTLPRLARELPARLLLLDPAGGAAGMSQQILAAADCVGADRLAVIDVGGDAMTNGHDEGLRSPLADLLAIAAASLSELPAQLVVPGPGIDGELLPSVVTDRLLGLGAEKIFNLDNSSIRGTSSVFEWHPSEASGMLMLAARGVRGLVEVRDAGTSLLLTETSADVYSTNLRAVALTGPAVNLRQTKSLHEAQCRCLELTGISEIDYENSKAVAISKTESRSPTTADLSEVDRRALDASVRGLDFVSIRRLAELIGVRTPEHLAVFRGLLAQLRSKRYLPPVYRVSPALSP